MRETAPWWGMCSAGEPPSLACMEGCSWTVSTDVLEEAQLLLFAQANAAINQNITDDDDDAEGI